MKKTFSLLGLLLVYFTVFAQTDEINKTDNNGLKQGKWIKYHSNGKIKYEGNFKDDKPIGQMKRYYSAVMTIFLLRLIYPVSEK